MHAGRFLHCAISFGNAAPLVGAAFSRDPEAPDESRLESRSHRKIFAFIGNHLNGVGMYHLFEEGPM